MAVTITLHPGVTFSAGTPVTIAILNALFSAGYGTIDSGTMDTANITDGAITGPKINATFDLTGKTLTLPVNRQPKTGITAASTVPDFIGQIGLTAGNVAYVAYGTSAGNWYRIDINDAVTSIAAAPTRVGQFAYAASTLYMAIGTATTADWKELNPQVYTMTDQVSDPAAPAAGTIKLYNKGDSFYVRTPAGIVNVSGAAFTAVQSATTPNFDSGWTLVDVNSQYDINSTSAGRIGGGGTAAAGGFSKTDKVDASLGITDCSTSNFNAIFNPNSNHLGYRFLRILIKRQSGGGTTYSSYIISGESFSTNYAGYGFSLQYDNAMATIVLTTFYAGIYTSTHSIGDWGVKTLTTGLLRIQAWL